MKWAQLDDCVVVSFLGVPEFGTTSSNTFQIEMFFNGVIRLFWMGMAARDEVIGLSRGTGLPAYFQETDLRAFGWDYDQDGIPNTWEMQYFAGITNCNGALDFDGDGLCHSNEYIAGKNPMDPSSNLRITDHSVMSIGGNKFVISWDPVEGGPEYSIWWTYNLQYVDFELLEGGIGYPVNSYTDTVDSAYGYRMYTVGVQLIE